MEEVYFYKVLAGYFIERSTPLLVFVTFRKLHKWYQITQSGTYPDFFMVKTFNSINLTEKDVIYWCFKKQLSIKNETIDQKLFQVLFYRSYLTAF